MPFPAKACIHQLFEARAAATPAAEALLAGWGRWTYAELNARANRVAHHLRALGVGPETLVGIFLDRSAEMVAALLGVLKAGGAYLPLDPAYPAERLAFMLEDAEVHTVLTQTALAATVRGLAGRLPRPPHLVCVDADEALARASEENPPPLAQAGNLAYVIYTSGSTGRPKGVALEHRNAVALIHWAARSFGKAELAGVLACTSISFDPSVLELLVPLCRGGRVILAANALELPRLPSASEVRLIATVPSAIAELLRVDGIPDSVETICLGGEPLSGQLVRELYARAHVRRVYDLYGPTETTTCSTCALRDPAGPATIGGPIANTQVYLLDPRLQPVPVGATGEIFIGGAGVARGYLHRPELTAERFLTLPAGGELVRVYRTGDLARYRPDGQLEYLGRADHQVKIRGYRVEPGEIEATLRLHPTVGQCVVVAREDPPGIRRLVAYVVRAPAPGPAGRTPDAENRLKNQLQAHLRDRLPAYLVPGGFNFVDRLALTPNGKIDRGALPAADCGRAGIATEYVAPRTTVEAALCRIWSDLLRQPLVGVHDNFFQLNGDSLLGMEMILGIEKVLGRRLRSDAILQAPTVAQLAAGFAAEDGAGPFDSSLLEIQRGGDRPRLFLVHGVGGGMLWGYANLARYLRPDQPVYAFRAAVPGAGEAFETIEQMGVRYVRDLRRFQPRGPYCIGGYCFGGNVAYEMARLLEAEGQRVDLVALLNSSPPNSSYDIMGWHPIALGKFSLNLFHWVRRFLEWQPAVQRRFLGWKLRTALRKAGGWFRRAGPAAGPDVDEHVDLSVVPGHERRLWDLHVRALLSHRHDPQTYVGRATLFRTRGHPLVCSFDGQCAWGEYVRGGLKVRIIPGLHESLLIDPHVRVLARELQDELDAVRPATEATA